MDISGCRADVHIRTDANNLVTTAQSTHLPEQKETIHMIQMLRKEACSGALDDLAHVDTAKCLSDCLTKNTAKPDELLATVNTGVLRNVDMHPPFRTMLKHKAYFADWILNTLVNPLSLFTVFQEPVAAEVSYTCARSQHKLCDFSSCD